MGQPKTKFLFPPLAWTIIFGLTFTTVLTLIVVPAMYTIVVVRKAEKMTAD